MRARARRRLALIAVGVAAGAASAPATAHAEGVALPCVATGLLAPIGDCPEPARPPGETPARAPEPKATPRGGCPDADLMPRRDNANRLAKATLCLLNRERTRRNRRALKRNRALDRVSASYARLMVQARFFDHVTPRGTTLRERVQTTSYLHDLRRWSLGENLAWGTGTLGSPAHTVRSWMRSPGHRRNVLNPRFREIGIGVALGIPTRIRNAPTGATYAHVFGQRVRR